MSDIILENIKKLLGIEAEETHYDIDVKIHVNTAIAELSRAGIPTSESQFKVSTGTEVWADYLGDVENVDDVKSFIYLKTRLLFDPPTTSFGINSANSQLDKMIFLLNVECESQEAEGG